MDKKKQDTQSASSLDPKSHTVNIEVPVRTGPEILIKAPVQGLFAAYLTLQEVGYNYTIDLIHFWASTTSSLLEWTSWYADAGSDGRSESEYGAEVLLKLLEGSPVHMDRKAFERRVLEFCYLLRTDMKVSLTRTAEVASALLGEQIDPEPWRKKLERYAEREHKPKPGKPRRRRNLG